MAADMEKASCGNTFIKCLVIDVLPAPEGAVMIKSLLAVCMRKETESLLNQKKQAFPRGMASSNMHSCKYKACNCSLYKTIK